MRLLIKLFFEPVRKLDFLSNINSACTSKFNFNLENYVKLSDFALFSREDSQFRALSHMRLCFLKWSFVFSRTAWYYLVRDCSPICKNRDLFSIDYLTFYLIYFLSWVYFSAFLSFIVKNWLFWVRNQSIFSLTCVISHWFTLSLYAFCISCCDSLISVVLATSFDNSYQIHLISWLF